jgi:hypothetical protein
VNVWWRGCVEVGARAARVTVARLDREGLWQPDDTDDPGPKGTFRALLKVCSRGIVAATCRAKQRVRDSVEGCVRSRVQSKICCSIEE